MMSGGGRKPACSGGDETEVEALLRAAQDAVLLKLQANSHLVSSSSSSPAAAALNPPAPSIAPSATDPLDADLARRFDELRSHPPPGPKRADAPSAAADAGGMDELEARFVALKGAAGPEKGETRVRLEDLGGESEEDEDDEVDKVMRWAMDAARLDVATAGADKTRSSEAEEEEEDQKSSSVSSEDGNDEERLELERERKRKEMMMSKNKATKSKWFSFF